MVSEETQSRPFILTVEFISFSKPHHFSSESGHKDVYPRGLLWKLLLLFSRSAVSNSLPLDRVQPTSSSVCGISQGRVLEWVATSFSRGSSRPQGGTQVACICGQILYQGATREASLWALLEIKRKMLGIQWALLWECGQSQKMRLWRELGWCVPLSTSVCEKTGTEEALRD